MDRVIVARTEPTYPSIPPFNPSIHFPELAGVATSSQPNVVFNAVRETMRLAGLDRERVGTREWNPLGHWIKPGQIVLLKPNFVREKHPRDADGWVYTVTHGSIIRAVAEYVAIALGGRGSIVVGDAPQTDSSFEKVAELTGTREVAESFRARGLNFELIDFRKEMWAERNGVIVAKCQLPGDPRGYVAFDLGDRSWFYGHRGAGKYYGAFYDEGQVNAHHSGGRHEYLITGSAIAADAYVNLPKLKTHKKTGVTLNLKNLVGINGDKNWLPHHTEGTPASGGDQFPSASSIRTIEQYAGKLARRLAVKLPSAGTLVLKATRTVGTRVAGDTETVVRSGNWHGNDTTWRMALDLNACLLWGVGDGLLRTSGDPKPYLSFVDGIIGGDGSGPLNPDPVETGLIAFGSQPADVDAVCAWLMGFDPGKIPVIREAYSGAHFPLATGSWQDVEVASNEPNWNGKLTSIAPSNCFSFRPHFGWTGAIERSEG